MEINGKCANFEQISAMFPPGSQLYFDIDIRAIYVYVAKIDLFRVHKQKLPNFNVVLKLIFAQEKNDLQI